MSDLRCVTLTYAEIQALDLPSPDDPDWAAARLLGALSPLNYAIDRLVQSRGMDITRPLRMSCDTVRLTVTVYHA